MNCRFFVGQKVVCVNDEWSEDAWGPDQMTVCPGPARVPMIHEVLTIAEMRGGIQPHTRHIVWLLFEEIGSMWASGNFRPLTDISVFEEMLARAPVAEREEAAHVP